MSNVVMWPALQSLQLGENPKLKDNLGVTAMYLEINSWVQEEI
jgi:hypothetical protein